MRLRTVRLLLGWLAAVVALYVFTAYLVLPRLWFHRDHQSGLAPMAAVTVTPDGIAGDALNVGLVGDQADVIRAMHLAGWFPADPLTLKSSIGIVDSVMLDRPDHDAPVSTLLYDGRKEDLAFELPIGTSADRRNHVRFWKVLDKGTEGRPVWLGSATQDVGVGVSRYTGQVTHNIGADIDAERNLLIDGVVKANVITELYQISGVGPTVNGRNGDGDRYYTDGEIKVAVISPGAVTVTAPPKVLADSSLIQWKDGVWAAAAGIVAPAETAQ
jgi:LssY C-terminus